MDLTTTKEDQLMTADGFEKAQLGILRRASQQDIIVYDYDRCVDILMKREQISFSSILRVIELLFRLVMQ